VKDKSKVRKRERQKASNVFVPFVLVSFILYYDYQTNCQRLPRQHLFYPKKKTHVERTSDFSLSLLCFEVVLLQYVDAKTFHTFLPGCGVVALTYRKLAGPWQTLI